MWGIRKKGIKSLGHGQTKEGVKGSGKDGERELKHGPYILELQLP